MSLVPTCLLLLITFTHDELICGETTTDKIYMKYHENSEENGKE